MILVCPGQDVQSELFCNDGAAAACFPEYVSFLKGLGWTVDLSTHRGFGGLLDARTTGKHSLYFANSTTEVAARADLSPRLSAGRCTA